MIPDYLKKISIKINVVTDEGNSVVVGSNNPNPANI